MTEEDKRELDNLIYTLHIHHIDTSLLFKMRDTIQKQQEEIKEMAIFIANLDIDENICKYQTGQFCENKAHEVPLGICVRCVKQYFESKV